MARVDDRMAPGPRTIPVLDRLDLLVPRPAG
jgi:hypothetical protein